MMTIITKAVERRELTSRICRALDGVVPLDVLYAAMPDVWPSAVRRLLSGLVADGAFVAAYLNGTHGKVWLDATGRRKWLTRDSDGALCTRVVPSRTFTHDRMAALLVGGFGYKHGMEFDRELPSNKCERKPDGIAWIAEHRALVVEVERMRGRNVHVWDDQRKNGLIMPGLLSGMVELLRMQQRQDANKPLCESLVCLPARFIAKLEAQLAPQVQQLGPKPCGWWSVPMENPEADLVWHPVRGDQRRNLAGLKRIKDGFKLSRVISKILAKAKAAQNGNPKS